MCTKETKTRRPRVKKRFIHFDSVRMRRSLVFAQSSIQQIHKRKAMIALEKLKWRNSAICFPLHGVLSYAIARSNGTSLVSAFAVFSMAMFAQLAILLTIENVLSTSGDSVDSLFENDAETKNRTAGRKQPPRKAKHRVSKN